MGPTPYEILEEAERKAGAGWTRFFKCLGVAVGMQNQEVTKGDKWGQDGNALHGAEQQDEDAHPGAGHLAGSGAVVLVDAAGRRR